MVESLTAAWSRARSLCSSAWRLPPEPSVPPANTLLFQFGPKPPYFGLPFPSQLIQTAIQILHLTEHRVCVIALALDLLLSLVGVQDSAVPLTPQSLLL